MDDVGAVSLAIWAVKELQGLNVNSVHDAAERFRAVADQVLDELYALLERFEYRDADNEPPPNQPDVSVSRHDGEQRGTP